MKMDFRGRLLQIGFFSTITFVASFARAAINEFDLYRTGNYTQSNAVSAPALDGYFFNSRVFMDSDADFDGGTLAYPGAGSPATYATAGAPGSIFLNFTSDIFPDKATLDTNFPMGTYSATATNSSTNAQQTTSQNYNLDAYSQSVPALTSASFTALQGFNPSQSQTVNFNSFLTDANANESDIFFTISNAANDTVFDSGFLPASATSVSIPVNTLSPLTSYSFHLDFSDRINGFNVDDNIFDVRGFDLTTSGSFVTGDVPEPTSLTILASAAVTALQTTRRRVN